MTVHEREPIPGKALLGLDRFVETSDGRRLRTMSRGDGEDLIVLEAGLGYSGLYWGLVHDAIAARARVVAYERSGFGASTPDQRPRDLARLAADLDAVIQAHPHRRLVLVGHSWGGPIVRTVARRRLDRGLAVDGVVLVDQSDENSDLYFSAMFRSMDSVQAALMVPLARVGLLRPLTRAAAGDLAEPLRSAVVTASTSVSAARAAAGELKYVVAGLGDLRQDQPNLDDIPVSVISGLKAGVLERSVRHSLVRAHESTAQQHAQGRFVPAKASGHMIPLTQPGLIASEALSLITG